MGFSKVQYINRLCYFLGPVCPSLTLQLSEKYITNHTLPPNTVSVPLPLSVAAGTLQQLISDTMVRWAQESVIDDPELVRAMFVLLHRQYDGIGGQVGFCLIEIPSKSMFILSH